MSVTLETTHPKVFVIRMTNGPVNSISKPLRAGLLRALVQAEEDPRFEAVVITGEKGFFSAGADLVEFSEGRAFDYPSFHAAVLPFIHSMRKPVVAAVNGRAIGGGFELALWCHARVAVPDAAVGLPETSLGLMPGAGGTQLLPRAVGLERATSLIVAGTVCPVSQFSDTSLFDAVVDQDHLLEKATELALQLAHDNGALPHISRQAVSHPQPEGFLQFARKQARSRRDFVPSMLVAIDAIEMALTQPALTGLAREFEMFRPLVASPEARAIRHNFFAERAASKVNGLDKSMLPAKVTRAAVVGAGFMGAGIAHCLARSGMAVQIFDAVPGAADRAVTALKSNAELAASDIKAVQALADLSDAQLVVEAVVEDLSVKKTLFRELDHRMPSDAIIASNTSTLDLNEIASATRAPERVVGMHFFGPAPVMKLLEVVRGASTSEATLVTVLDLAKRMKKIPVVSGVGPGFIANRIYNRLMTEALELAAQGIRPANIDAALERWGWRMGPFKTMDLIGLDVLIKARGMSPSNTRGERLQDQLVAMGRLGQKAGKGWYDYVGGKPQATQAIDALLPGASMQLAAEDIASRCLAALINEGAHVLDEGVAQRASDIDTCFVHGYGFPRLKGGPMFAAEESGLITVLQTVRQNRDSNGTGDWRPSAVLERKALSTGRWE